MIYSEVSKYEKQKQSNESTYWLKFELMWRDFFRFMAKKHGNKIFQLSGYKEKIDPDWEVDWEKFNKWAKGETGIPFIDANMKEINATGYMSNRGRQNVASFLINDLKLNWLMGAEYFESLLIDYDPTSNYGNWCYLAGVGSDPMENRSFNILSQAQRYDPEGEYVKKWLPDLQELPKDKIHEPYSLSEEEGQEYSMTSYPDAIIDPDW
jgi:deoxyribodipyrimidine photo-lyase